MQALVNSSVAAIFKCLNSGLLLVERRRVKLRSKMAIDNELCVFASIFGRIISSHRADVTDVIPAGDFGVWCSRQFGLSLRQYNALTGKFDARVIEQVEALNLGVGSEV